MDPSRDRPEEPTAPSLAASAAGLLAYVVASWAGWALSHPGSPIAAVWMPAGVWLAMLLLHPRRTWPALSCALLVVGFASSLAAGRPTWVAAAFTLSNIGGGLLSALVFGWALPGRTRLDGVRDLLVLLAAGAAGRAVSGVLSAAVVDAAFGVDYASAWWSWWSSGVAGLLVVAPVALSPEEPPHPRRGAAALEAAALAAALGVAALIFLTTPLPGVTHRFLFFPCLVWAALRFNVRGVGLSGLAVTVVLLASVRFGIGELAPQGRAAAHLALNIQLYLATALVSTHVLAIVARERRRALAAARAAQERFSRAEASERLASIGTLAAGVAHEINNPLAYVVANLDWVLDRRRESGRAEEEVTALEEAREGTARVAEIVRGLRVFSRAPAEDQRAALDVRGPLRAALNLAQPEIRHRARLALELADVPPVIGEEARLAQVFLNVLVNAAQAIPAGRAAQQEIAVRTRVEGRDVVVEIRDSGCGMPPEVQARIFEPFFTTKPPGVGTGLGLSICHGIVAAHGGAMEVQSRVGVGTAFRVRLPRAPDATPAPRPRERPHPAAAPERPRVLVVDDEPLVGRAVAQVLEANHEVACTTDPQEALRRLAGGEPVDVVVCDVRMPGMSGAELWRRVVEARPALRGRFVFVSGAAVGIEAEELLASGEHELLSKPFAAAELRAAVAARLRAPAPPAA